MLGGSELVARQEKERLLLYGGLDALWCSALLPCRTRSGDVQGWDGGRTTDQNGPFLSDGRAPAESSQDGCSLGEVY